MAKQTELASSEELAQFDLIICQYIGLSVPKNEWITLAEILRERIHALHMDSVAGYFLFLESAQAKSDQEWALLANRLRIGESYFFRDSGQMSLLETIILPELLQCNATKRELRLLSAGCSTGEEVYSIAILLERIMPIWDTWDIRILGVDIDAQALDTACKGIYTDWSFRRVPKVIKNTYFEKRGAYWQIHPRIRSKVEFHRLNLVKHNLPAADLQIADLDLIVCRNVFIYFQRDIIASLVDKFANSMNPEGYLLTGHGELQGIKHPMLAARSFATSVAYQKLAHETRMLSQTEVKPPTRNLPPRSLPKGKGPPASVVSRATTQKTFKLHPQNNRPSSKKSVITGQTGLNGKEPKQQSLAEAVHELHGILQQGLYNQVIAIGTCLLERSPHNLKVWQFLAQAHANLGRHMEATSCCTRLLDIDACYAPAYLIMAHIALEQGQKAEGIALLKKVLYLDPDCVAPLLELAEIYAQDGDARKATQMREVACRVLNTLPEDALVDMLDNWTAETC